MQARSSSSQLRPLSMFDVPCSLSTATMSTGDATKGERPAGSMSDEAREAMMDVAAQTPSNAVGDRPSPAASDDVVTAPQSAKPGGGCPLAKLATEIQDARQVSSRALTSLASGESDGKGDTPRLAACLVAGSSLYPALNASSAKTLLDYYSARAAERTQQPSRNQYAPPRVTMSFFPSFDRDSPMPPGTPFPVAAHGTPTYQPRYQPRRMQSESAGLRSTTPAEFGYRRQPRPAAATGGEQTDTVPATTAKSDATPIGPAATTKAASSTEQTLPGAGRQVLKPADRKLSEPARLPVGETPVRGGGEAPSSGSAARRMQSTGAATDVFLSTILSHLVPPPSEKDWGHFTLVRPAIQGKNNLDNSKATVTSAKR